VKDRINAVNSALCSSDQKRRILIDPACKRTIECLSKQTYKPGTQIPDKDSGWDHQNDALGYAASAIYPVTLEHKRSEPLGNWRVKTS
jgi:hypothetical protein